MLFELRSNLYVLWQALRGIAVEDWRAIRQVAMEVHDIDGALAAAQDIMKAAGFQKVVTTQAPALAGSAMHMLYALRL